ncbi:hypothetical protein [Paracoccus spongiarum]|uniref:Uncharacterized protein n=1 Tax=Paracoccus spongiarum TaxID=3064387 RepID=A0ABT9J7K9_9RHOB|nr:hypothetical protein [Paracoccus sp. 2205BS29-5]MDP5305799.1 hypothetical protein [Paracoccus sp. 2205BS29-5]
MAAAVLGVLVWLLTAGIGPMRWFEGLVLAAVATALLGAFLIWLLCRGEAAQDGSHWQPAEPAPPSPTMPLQAASASALPVAALPAADDPVGAGDAAVAPSGDAVAGGETAARPRSTRNDIYGGGAGRQAGTAPDAADDLKKIKGVGPKLEEVLHQHGISRFAQIAGWDDAEIDRMAEAIGRMGGRIRSDDWVGQARILAAGGETEFSGRVEDGEVY